MGLQAQRSSLVAAQARLQAAQSTALQADEHAERLDVDAEEAHAKQVRLDREHCMCPSCHQKSSVRTICSACTVPMSAADNVSAAVRANFSLAYNAVQTAATEASQAAQAALGPMAAAVQEAEAVLQELLLLASHATHPPCSGLHNRAPACFATLVSHAA